MSHPDQALASTSAGNVTGHSPATTEQRPDIQGLRAIAVLLVVVYHLWPNRITGGFAGVDVFFVISGYLITSHLLRRPPRSFTEVLEFWARRVRRLLPAALLVLGVTTIGVRLLAPETHWRNWSLDAIAAALYGVNWRLAATSVDYLAAENAASPVQHFWSLSVEEQFYFVWPILIALVIAGALRRRWLPRSAVLVALGVVVALSLGFSIYATAREPASAYFITPTRIWELGAGGLLAAALVKRAGRPGEQWSSLQIPAPFRVLLGWAGLACIAATAVLYTVATPFPSWTALLPVLGTVAVIAANPPLTWASPVRYLAWRPIQWLGDVSYSVYLWHWPMIVLLPFISGGHLGRLDKLLIIASTLLLAGLTKTYVEDRFRTSRSKTAHPLRRSFQLAAAGMAVVLTLGAVQIVEFTHRQVVARSQLLQALEGDKPCFGAAAMADPSCPPTTKGPVLPAPAQAAVDKSEAYADDCWESSPFAGTRECVFGDPNGSVSIALVGNSHAGQWLGPIDAIARSKGWKVTTFLASMCTATSIDLQWTSAEGRDGCRQWGRNVLEATTTGEFDLVLTAERNSFAAAGKSLSESEPVWEKGYSDYLRSWLASDVNVAVIQDSPLPAKDIQSIPDCVAEHMDDLEQCAGDAGTWIPDDPLVRAATKLQDERVSVIDLNASFCTTTCPAVIGGVVVYFDGSHITNTYAMTLAPYLVGPLGAAVRGATAN